MQIEEIINEFEGPASRCPFDKGKRMIFEYFLAVCDMKTSVDTKPRLKIQDT